jgi:hypothetical protein
MADRARELVRAEFDLDRNVDRLLAQFQAVPSARR